MAYYRMSGSSKGELHGASVLVTVDGEIESGDTVTLTKTGYSQTKTLSDVKTALFTDILDSGTYTATYKTFSNTVEVSAQDVLDKTTKSVTVAQSVTLTLTIEGAKEDNIKVYKEDGTELCSPFVFGTGETTCTQTITIPKDGIDVRFESTVAKDTTTGTSNYSKNVSLTNSTTDVKCMPDGALYWYGNECESVTGGFYLEYNTDYPYKNTLTKNATNMTMNCGYSRAQGELTHYNTIDTSQYTKLRMTGYKTETPMDSSHTYRFYVCFGGIEVRGFDYQSAMNLDIILDITDVTSGKFKNQLCEVVSSYVRYDRMWVE